MNRRRFLTMLGLAPAALAVPTPSTDRRVNTVIDIDTRGAAGLEQYRVQQYVNSYGSMDAASQQQFEMLARRQRQATLAGVCQCPTCKACWDAKRRAALKQMSDHDLRIRLDGYVKYSDQWVEVAEELRRREVLREFGMGDGPSTGSGNKK